MANPITQTVEYDLESVKLPYLAGLPLRVFVALMESPLRGLLVPRLFRDAGITRLREQRIDEPPTLHPVHFGGGLASGAGSVPADELPGPPAAPGPGFRFASVHAYASAYREGKTTPEEVAHRVLEAVEVSNGADPPLRAIIAMDREDVLRQARAAAKRIKEGRALSVPRLAISERKIRPVTSQVRSTIMRTPYDVRSPCAGKMVSARHKMRPVLLNFIRLTTKSKASVPRIKPPTIALPNVGHSQPAGVLSEVGDDGALCFCRRFLRRLLVPSTR